MEINFNCYNKFQIEKKNWTNYLTNELSFVQQKNNPEVYINRNSFFSINPQLLQIKVDFTSFPELKIMVKNVFLSFDTLKALTKNWFAHTEEQVFVWSKADQSLALPKVSLLSSKTIGGLSELFSRLVVPTGLVILLNLVIYTGLCFALLKGIMCEIQYDDNVPPTYLSFNQLKPSVIELYQSNSEVWKASFLCALIGGGWFLGLQQLLICYLIKFGGVFFRNVMVSLIILGVLQGFLYFSPLYYGWWVVFIPITIISYLLFGFFSRSIPIFMVKKKL